MDEQRAWIKMRRKKRLRILAVALCFSVLLTTYPDIWENLSVFAAESGREENADMEQADENSTEDTGEDADEQETGDADAETEEPSDGEETDAETEEPSDGEEVDTENKDGDTEETDGNGQEAVEESGNIEENGTDAMIQALLERIAALPELEEYFAAEPDVDDEEAYAEWEEKLYEYAEEAHAIQEEYELLTGKWQAQIPEEELGKLLAWVEIAEATAPMSAAVFASSSHSSHPACGASCSHSGTHGTHGSLNNWTAFTKTGGGDLASGNYYLTGDVTLTQTLKIPEGNTVNLCLNSYKISPGWSSSGTWDESMINPWGTLTVCDCVGGGELNGKSVRAVLNEGDFNLYGGTISSDAVGIRSDCGDVIIAGGAVTGGTYGVYLTYGGDSLTLVGAPEISGVTADLYLFTGEASTPDDAVVDATGYTGGALTVEERELSEWNKDAYAIKVSDGSKNKFTLTNTGWCYLYENDGLYLSDHIHNYTYGASGEVITETCTNSCNHSATATLSLQSDADLTYTGSAIKPVTVTYSDGWAGTGEKKPDDSKITYTNNTNAGTATAKLTVSGKTASFDFTIASAEMSGVSASGYTGTYDGNAHGITVTAPNGATVKYGTSAGSYTLTSSPTYTDAGTHTVYYQVTKTNYTSVTGSAEVKISARSISDATVTLNSATLTYSGSEQTKGVSSVKVNNKPLTAETDYTISGNKGTNAGTYTITITGKGNYTGTKTATFTIAAKSLNSNMITVASGPHNCTGSEIKPTVTVKDGGTTLTSGTDYTVSYADNVNPGTAKVTVTGKGNYKGNINKTFTIEDNTPPVIDLANMTVENGAKNLWNWIIGKKSMIIKIPTADIRDAHSSIKEVTYTTISDSGTQQTKTLSVKSGYYEIALNAEFTGTIRLTAKDTAGNTTQVSLTTEGGKVVAEDYAPVVAITLPITPKPNVNGWYNTAFAITVTVTDNKSSGGAAITSGGIAEIKWKDGENGAEQTVSELPGNAPVYEKKFTIQATDGTHTYYVKAVDNAGNESGWKTHAVSLDTVPPVFSRELSVTNRTKESADITFTPSEGGKVYWIVGAETTPSAQEVVNSGTQSGNKKDITGGTQGTFTVSGFLPGTTHKVYVALEDAAGNLSEVKEISFTTLQAAPEITLGNLTIDYEKETVKLSERLGGWKSTPILLIRWEA